MCALKGAFATPNNYERSTGEEKCCMIKAALQETAQLGSAPV
jgi:hypothetical protein